MVHIRPATQGDIADIVRVHIETWKAQFTPFLTAQQVALKELNVAKQIQLWQTRFADEEGNTRFTFIAGDDDVSIAYITGQFIDDDYDAELHQIYVLPSLQGRGIGKQLVEHLAKRLYEAGRQSLLVWVMKINPAVKFYSDVLGGTLITERIISNGDGILKESAYAWSDIQDLFR